MLVHVVSASFIVIALAAGAGATAAPKAGGIVVSSGERPQVGTAPPPATVALYGLCKHPQNADAFPSSPVPVVETTCDFEQRFTATSAGPSTGATCGGYTIVLGPAGDLKTNPRSHTLVAEWGDPPITSPSACTKARIAATAQGFRCTSDDCSTGAWERIGVPRRMNGTWLANVQKCSLVLGFGIADRRYNTLNLDIITEQLQGANMVRKRAKGTIVSKRGNGKCFTVDQPPR